MTRELPQGFYTTFGTLSAGTKVLGLHAHTQAPKVSEKFDEAFLTSSSRGIVPIVSIDGNPVGEGKAGVWTKKLMKAYREYVERKAEEIGGDW